MKVQVRSNVWGELNKIRNGVVYGEVSSVIVELLQNAQRSKATKVDVKLRGNELRVRDNGIGCKDPQMIFEKDTAGWDDESEAFGEGFFSTFLVADRIELRSLDWEIELDVEKMIEERNADCVVKKSNRYLDGFEVVLIGERIKEKGYRIENKGIELAKYLPQMEVAWNGSPVEKESILTMPPYQIRGLFHRYFDNDIYEAILCVDTYPFVDQFYDHRPMTDRFCEGVRGRVHFKKGAVTPKAPDRMDLVVDIKTEQYVKQLTEDAKVLYTEFLAQASDADLDRYADGVSKYLDVEEYIDMLALDEKVLGTKAKEKKIEDEEQPTGMNEEMAKMIVDTEQTLRRYKEEVRELEGDKEPDEKRIALREWLLQTNRDLVVWINSSELEQEEDLKREAEYLGFVVLVAKNKLYEKAFKYLELTHIEVIMDKVNLRNKVENVGPMTKKEKRLEEMVFSRIEEYFNVPKGTIKWTDLEVDMYFEDRKIERGGTVNGCFDREDRKIYLNRKQFNLKRYAPATDSNRLGIHDYRIMLLLGPTIAHELAHMIFETQDNTKEHTDRTAMILRMFEKALS